MRTAPERRGLRRARGQHHLVQRRHLVAHADLAGVDGVDPEVGVGDRAVLVAEQAVARDHRRIELDLQLHVLGHDLEHRHQVGGEQLGRRGGAVDVVVVAVAAIAELLHQLGAVVAHAEADRRERHRRRGGRDR
jgi:hypothetical protein